MYIHTRDRLIINRGLIDLIYKNKKKKTVASGVVGHFRRSVGSFVGIQIYTCLSTDFGQMDSCRFRAGQCRSRARANNKSLGLSPIGFHCNGFAAAYTHPPDNRVRHFFNSGAESMVHDLTFFIFYFFPLLSSTYMYVYVCAYTPILTRSTYAADSLCAYQSVLGN